MRLFKIFDGEKVMILLLEINLLLSVKPEEVYFSHNGTHSLNQNITKVEVTTVRIAQIVNYKSYSTNTTVVVKEKTAKHFVTSTPNSKAVLIPPAKIDSQIVNKRNESVRRIA